MEEMFLGLGALALFGLGKRFFVKSDELQSCSECRMDNLILDEWRDSQDMSIFIKGKHDDIINNLIDDFLKNLSFQL